MRKYACLREPLRLNEHDEVFKIMLFETAEGIYLFEYDSLQAVQSSGDILYASLEDLYEDWNELLDDNGWIALEDPLPGCQHDAFIPLRVKGRLTGKPQWDCYETLKDGEWVDYED